jgi:hypothetical protein
MIARTGLSEFLTPDQLGAERVVVLGGRLKRWHSAGRHLVACNLYGGGRDSDGDEDAGSDARE